MRSPLMRLDSPPDTTASAAPSPSGPDRPWPPSLAGAEYPCAQGGVRVQNGGDGGPVESGLPDDPHQIALIVHHAVAHGNAAGVYPLLRVITRDQLEVLRSTITADSKVKSRQRCRRFSRFRSRWFSLAVDLGLIQLPLQLGVLLFSDPHSPAAAPLHPRTAGLWS